jgi:VanZ family protein
MGKAEVRIIVVRRSVTVALLVAVSLLIVLLLLFLSGKAYVRDRPRWIEILSNGVVSKDALLAALMPPIANALLFFPWGFLMFLAVDRAGRPRLRAYVLTVAASLAFAAALVGWQYSLPTRVTGWFDTAGNAAGALCGALFGDLRRRVRIRFE